MKKMTNFQELYSFIDSAAKNHKYAENTAMGHKAALKLFEPLLNEDEKSSIGLVKSNIEGIFSKVFGKNKEKITAESLNTYKLRVLKIIADYEAYGVDPAKMASWVPRRRNVTKSVERGDANTGERTAFKTTNGASSEKTVSGSASGIELGLRPGFVIALPRDITTTEVGMIKALLDSLVKSKNQDETTIE